MSQDRLEAWLETVQTEALRELSGTNMHGKNKAEVVAYIMRTPEAREIALESMRKTLGLSPRKDFTCPTCGAIAYEPADTKAVMCTTCKAWMEPGTWGDPPWGWEQEEERKLHS